MPHEECLICGEPLEYSGTSGTMTCAICKKESVSNCRCASGHYVCDACHGDGAFSAILKICLSSGSCNPQEIADELMRDPAVHMHGPEHHVLVGSALLTAYRNARGNVDLPSALLEMRKRGSTVPGGVCGNAGCCGAAVSAGMFYSIATFTTPLSGKSWGMANILTSRCLEAIGIVGGPRCCKRNTALAIRETVKFVNKNMGIPIESSEGYVCEYSNKNTQCIKERCPFHKNGCEI